MRASSYIHRVTWLHSASSAPLLNKQIDVCPSSNAQSSHVVHAVSCVDGWVVQALESKRSELSGFANGGAALYSETIRYLTIVQIDNLWIQQLEVSLA